MKLSELVAYRSALKQFDFYRDSRLLVKTILEAKAHVDDKVNSETNQQIKFGAGVYQDEMDRDLLRLEESISELGENFEYYKKQFKRPALIDFFFSLLAALKGGFFGKKAGRKIL